MITKKFWNSLDEQSRRCILRHIFLNYNNDDLVKPYHHDLNNDSTGMLLKVVLNSCTKTDVGVKITVSIPVHQESHIK